MMELRRLKYFEVVARELHFGRAAEILRIAQPALSQQIQVLETEMGFQLFNRDRRGVELTASGAAILPEVQSLLKHSDQVSQNIEAIRTGRSGTLRVMHNRSTPEFGTGSLLDEFRASNPDIRVEVESGWTLHNCEMIRAGRAEVAFVRFPLDDSEGLETLELGRTELYIAVPEGHRLASLERVPASELAGERAVLTGRKASPGYFKFIVDTVWGGDEPDYLEEPDASFALAAVRAGAGICVLDGARAALLAPQGVVLRRFTDPVPRPAYGVAWTRDAFPNPSLKLFIDFTRRWVAQQEPS